MNRQSKHSFPSNSNHKNHKTSLERGRKEKVVDSLNLPKDLLLGASILTVIGSHEACIENYKGIIEYTEESIVIQGKNCQICFRGRQLSIDYYTNEDMKISGCIAEIHYMT
ncbi:MAG: YabP/YqfC family sporulation protein [Lachnospiraceae bacterium]